MNNRGYPILIYTPSEKEEEACAAIRRCTSEVTSSVCGFLDTSLMQMYFETSFSQPQERIFIIRWDAYSKNIIDRFYGYLIRARHYGARFFIIAQGPAHVPSHIQKQCQIIDMR